MENVQKKKRQTSPSNNERRQQKRKRPNSPTISNDSNSRLLQSSAMSIKNEEQDIMMMPMPSSNPTISNNNNNMYQQTMYPTLPPCSDVLQHRNFDRLSSSRTRSISSSVIQPDTNPLIHYSIKNPMSVQPMTNIPKHNRKQTSLPLYSYDKNNNHNYRFDLRPNDESSHNRISMPSNNSLNVPNGVLRFDHFTNSDMFPNVSAMQHHDEKMRKTLSADESIKYYHHDRQVNIIFFEKHI